VGELLAGRTALITGASRGLGRRVAEVFWQQGASVVVAARGAAALEDLVAGLAASSRPGQVARAVAADLSRDDGVPLLMTEIERLGGGVDVLVNNAAAPGPIGPAWENDWEAWQATLRVNLLAPVELCRACAPLMRRRRRGKMINLSGGGATGPRPNFSAYATAKAALVRFSEVLAAELQPDNVQVNCVAPGTMNTELLRSVLAAGPERAGPGEYERARREGERGDQAIQRAADLCLFLASARGDRITGKLLSAVWDPWESLEQHLDAIGASDIYTLRRIVPGDRGESWS
jgi:NAD(P)-dependent dehydrogenase (short-subunit alcohol dehydrogenase family)